MKKEKALNNRTEGKESGRSMIEMLGVLAIMGVLSLTSLYGYRYFRTKQQADALVNEVNLRATGYSSELVKNPPSSELTPLDTSHFAQNMGYEFQAGSLQDQFYIVAGEVPQDVCEHVLSAKYQVPFQVDVNENRNINGDEDACDQEMNEVTFHFKNDLQGCEGSECDAMEICKEGEVYCGLKCYKSATHECLYPNNEICQKTPYPGLDSSPICQTGEDSYTCCPVGSFCRLDSSTAPYYKCAQCEEYEKVMPDGTCCPLDKLCGNVCCSNSEYVCKENMYCVQESQWCENTACAAGERCTSVGCCLVQKACQNDTKCCEEGEVCSSQDNVCCPEKRASALKCCEEGEEGYKNLCCDAATTKGMTSNGLDICCPLDRVCTKNNKLICSKYPNAATGVGACEAIDCEEGQEVCNTTCYDPNEYECINNSLCKTGGTGASHMSCGGTCCDTTTSTCINGRTCCPNERVNGEGETASCCASGTSVVNGACCANNRKCVIDGEEVCCPEGNCCKVGENSYACCSGDQACLNGSEEGVKMCMVPPAAQTCESNEDCPATQFCKSANNVAYDAAEKKGTCTNLSKNTQTLELDGKSTTWTKHNSGAMNRWSAENFCDALGMTLVTDKVMCPGGDVTQVSNGGMANCEDYTMQYVAESKFGSGISVHVKKNGNVAYVERLKPMSGTDGTVSYGENQTGEALCMPKDFKNAWSCPGTRPYYSPKFKTCVARICSAAQNGTIIDACPNNEYCHYDTNWSGGECGDKVSHTGVCRPINEIVADLEFSVTADGNTTNHVWKQSTISMPWLSAEDLCHKLGRQVVTRTQLCGLTSGLGSTPCSEAATYMAVTPKTSRPFWMEESSECTAYRHINSSFGSVNKSLASDNVGAVCSELAYKDPCGETSIFNKDDKTCTQICRTNGDCVGGKYCDLITFTTDNGCYFESGVCRSVAEDRRDYTISYDDGDYYTSEDWVTSTRKMSWDSAKNFCAAMSRPMVTQSSFLSDETPKKCTTSLRCMTARDVIDNSSSTWWFEDDPVENDTCKAYKATSSDLGRDVLPSAESRKTLLTPLCGPFNVITKPCECDDGSCEASCLPKNGMCSYDLTQSPTSLEADCHYTFRNQTQSLSADCHYKITDSVVSGNVHSITLTKVQGCKSDKYCYLNYSKADCSTAASASIGSTKTEDIYGVCINKNQVNTQCHINITTPPTLTKIKGCTSDKYCYLNYSKADCSTAAGAAIGANQTEDIYGVCINKNQVNTQCTIKGGDMTLTKNVGCPIGKYCYLNWTEKSCSATAGASYLGTFWGTCISIRRTHIRVRSRHQIKSVLSNKVPLHWGILFLSR